MTQTPIIESRIISGEEIDKVIKGIIPSLEGVPRSHVVTACLSIAISCMNPTITPEELQKGVRGASEWICTFLSCSDPRCDNLTLN